MSAIPNHPDDSRAAAPRPLLPLSGAVLFPGESGTLRPSPEWWNSLSAPPTPGTELVLAAPGVLARREGCTPGRPCIGVLARVFELRLEEGHGPQLQVVALGRVRFVRRDTHLEPVCEVWELPVWEETLRSRELALEVLTLAEKVLQLDPRYPAAMGASLRSSAGNSGVLADRIAGSIHLAHEDRIGVLETVDPAGRLSLLRDALTSEAGRLEAPARTSPRELPPEPAPAPHVREFPSPADLEAHELLEKLSTSSVPAHVVADLRREIEKLPYSGTGSHEHAELRTHIDWVLGLPWRVHAAAPFDLDHVQRVLDAEHFGQEKAKERILEYLAVLRLRRDAPSPILCLVGPPGTGKSSLARAVARALSREFVCVSVAGVREEAEIRGRRRPHATSQPGLILETLRNVGTLNPVFEIDDIDKVGHDGHSTDPTGALLDVVDPERNHAFVDHYLQIPFDLSNVLFIVTANMLEMVPDALVDRLEVIEIPGYTDGEKRQIVETHLLPRALERHGLEAGDISLGEATIFKLIREYALEAGLRNLQRQIEAICRKCARRYARGDVGPWDIGPEDIEGFLGAPVHIPEVAERAPEVGVATGLAWTPAGGDLLTIESIRMPGGGRMVATGQLGEVMRESVQAAFSLVRLRAEVLGIPLEAFGDVDIHVHFPAGGIPKDGPSAGITITVALASLFSNRPVRHDVASTGEVSLRGKVLPVGGIREKVMAAHRAGIRTVILPRANLKNLQDVPNSVREEMTFVGVEHMDEVFASALLEALPEEAAAGAETEVAVVKRRAGKHTTRRRKPRAVAAKSASGKKRRTA